MLRAQSAIRRDHNIVLVQLIRICIAVSVGLIYPYGVRVLLTFAALRTMIAADSESTKSRLVLHFLDPLIHDSAVSGRVINLAFSCCTKAHLHRCDDSSHVIDQPKWSACILRLSLAP